MDEAYLMAQRAVAELKAAIYMAMRSGPDEGLRNADIGRLLGIYAGHVGHEGHIPRTLLALMESEGVVHQDTEKRWTLRHHPEPDERESGISGRPIADQ